MTEVAQAVSDGIRARESDDARTREFFLQNAKTRHGVPDTDSPSADVAAGKHRNTPPAAPEIPVDKIVDELAKRPELKGQAGEPGAAGKDANVDVNALVEQLTKNGGAKNGMPWWKSAALIAALMGGGALLPVVGQTAMWWFTGDSESPPPSQAEPSSGSLYQFLEDKDLHLSTELPE